MSGLEETVNQGLLDAALEISAKRADNLRQIKSLILDGKKDQAWALLLKHLGIDENRKPAKIVRFPKR